MISNAPGTIALPTSEVGRFAMFTASLAGTLQPPGTYLAINASASVTQNLNAVISQLRDEDEWVWILGDDHVWPNHTLRQMLERLDEHPEIDILVPLVVKRNPPWHLVVFHEDGEVDGLPRWRPFAWEEIPETGVFEVDAAGSAGMLVRREVFDAIGDPWFQSTGGVVLNEDVTFCRDAKALGYRIFADAEAIMGHLGIFNVRPKRVDGRWGAMVEFATPEVQYREVFMPDTVQPHVAAVNGR